MLDFGGGLGIPYFANEQELDLAALLAGLTELMRSIANESCFSHTHFVVEPGRFLAGESGVYLARVNDIKISRGKKFLITDGGPTDEWKSAAEAVKQGEASKAFSFFCVAVEGANMEILRQICTRAPLSLKGLRFRDLFVWLSQSQRSVSRSSPGDNVPLANPATPEGWASV